MFGTALKYAKQASTWQGLFKVISSMGVLTISPTQEGAFVALGLAIAGVIDVFRNEKKDG